MLAHSGPGHAQDGHFPCISSTRSQDTPFFLNHHQRLTGCITLAICIVTRALFDLIMTSPAGYMRLPDLPESHQPDKPAEDFWRAYEETVDGEGRKLGDYASTTMNGTLTFVRNSCFRVLSRMIDIQ